MKTLTLARSFGRYRGLASHCRPSRSAIHVAVVHLQEATMNTFTLVRSYGRYILSALAALAFGVDGQ